MVIGWILGLYFIVDFFLGFFFLGNIIVLNVFKKIVIIVNGTLEEKFNGNFRLLECFFFF